MAEIARMHHVDVAWDRVMEQIHAEVSRRQLHPARVVILLPFAQLMPQARSAWLRLSDIAQAKAQFMPRFETTQNWTRSLAGFAPGQDDLRLDAAHDVLTAASLLTRAGLAAQQDLLAPRLMESAWSLARIAAAVAPPARAKWAADLGLRLAEALDSPLLALEAALARIALAWIAHSTYESDSIFSASPDLLVLLEGFQTDPMTLALQQTFSDRILLLNLAPPPEGQLPQQPAGQVALHAAQDAEDEAQRAAACVLLRLAAGRTPVALVAQDRLLTRRVHAMLSEQGVAVRDETGWKLSTTRAAAALMSLLRAVTWDASTDAVLDWLKNAPTFDPKEVTEAEQSWRRLAAREWRSVPEDGAVALQAQTVRETLQAGRSLPRWLADLRAALQSSGQWSAFLLDPAGQAVLDALRLNEDAELEFSDVAPRMNQSHFTAWVSQTLEAMSFSPPCADSVQVLILPLSQLLGRPLAAVVLPGCDELNLPTAPEPPGIWTPALRALLGLPAREALATAAKASWQYALDFPQVDLLWRLSDGGERVMASGFVQALRLQTAPELSLDTCLLRSVSRRSCVMPAVRGDSLALARLSSTAYEDLRRCPYRFFALRQLKLQESDELDTEIDKRDFGNWLHQVLKLFHDALQRSPGSNASARQAMIDAAADQATLALGLSSSEFLPFAASWPRLRAGYLAWLAEHEAGGATYGEGEAWREMALGALTLVGKIDRIDRLSDGSTLVIDYKTEASSTTTQRIKAGLEDSQLAFYAALLRDDTLSAAYVNVAEKEGSKSYRQDNIVDMRDQLVGGIVSDMTRIAEGHSMAALGEGKACEFCAARGLCRKDFWT